MNIHKNAHMDGKPLVAGPANEINLFNCDQCEYITKRSDSLKRHMGQIYQGAYSVKNWSLFG